MARQRPALYRYFERLGTERWAWRGLRTILRSLWLALSVACVVMGGVLLWGWELDWRNVAAIALGVMLIGLLSMLTPRLSPQTIARRLDRRFDLNEQLTTAVEVARTAPEPGSIPAQLLQQSARTTRGLQQTIRRRMGPPWRDLFTVLAMLLVALGMFLLSGIGRPDLAFTPSTLPPLAQLAEQPPQPDAPPEQQAAIPDPNGQPGGTGEGQKPSPGEQAVVSEQPGAVDPQTLQALADALRDQGVTRPAADALERGDLSGAAQELRELADNADQLSDDTRRDIADSLRDAADQIGERDPGLAQELRESADQIEQGDQTAEGLEQLADAIEQLGNGDTAADQPQPGQEGQPSEQGQEGQADGGSGGAPGNAPSAQQRPAPEAERLNVDGQTVTLESKGTGQSGNGNNRRPSATVGNGSGNNRSGQSGASGTSGPDPLRVPLDERDVVQDYFTPR